MAFDGLNVWVSTYYGGAVIKLRLSDGATLETIQVPNALSAARLAFDGAHIWCTDNLGNRVRKL
jgi:sugar lactone lactonase YvrE